MKVKVSYVSIDELTPYPNNPRVITEEDQLYFESRPIICSTRTGAKVIIAGEKRFIAANRLGMKTVPVAVIPDLSEEDERRILVKDPSFS